MDRILGLFLCSVILMGCSLRGEDVLLQRIEISKNIDRSQVNVDFLLKIRKLVQKNPNSLHAHAAYITSRWGARPMVAEYKELSEKNKGPLHDYLYLRARFTLLEYKQQNERRELVSQMEKLALENKEIKEEALYDLADAFIRDKKRAKEIAKELYEKKKDYGPYKRLYYRKIDMTKEAELSLSFCEEALKSKKNQLGLCDRLDELNEDTAKGLLKRRDEAAMTLFEQTLKKADIHELRDLYNIFSSLNEVDPNFYKGKKESIVKVATQKKRDWIPRESYRLYFGELNYASYEIMEKLGKINKMIDFKERIASLEDLMTRTVVKDNKNVMAQVLANMGYAYLNPANLNKEKAYKYLKESNHLLPGRIYTVMNLIDLMLEFNRDLKEGLEIVEQNLILNLEKTESSYLGYDPKPDFILKLSKGHLALLYNYMGRLYFQLGNKDKSRYAFLKSYQVEETELAAYFLGELYQEKSPLLAIDFLAQSIKKRSPEDPMKEELSKKRKNLLEKLHGKYYRRKLQSNYEGLLSIYEENKDEKEENKTHEFIGGPLKTAKLLDVMGGEYDWKKTQGKNVILSFWATWCTPCFQEMAVLNKIQKEGKLKDLKIIGVCTDGIAQKGKVKKILKKSGIEFDILLDDGSFRDQYLVSAIPSMFFLDKSGNFIKHKTGYSPELEDDIFKIFQ